MKSPLFRREALEAYQVRQLGEVRVTHPPTHTVVAIVAALLLSLLCAFVYWGQLARKVRVPGIIVPSSGTLQLSSPAQGVLIQRLVGEGDYVTKGSVIFKIDVDRTVSDGSSGAIIAKALAGKGASLAEELVLREGQANRRKRAVEERLVAIRDEIAHADLEISNLGARIRLARDSVGKYRELNSTGFMSEIQVRGKEEELLELMSREAAANRLKAGLERQRSSLQSEIDDVSAQLSADSSQIKRLLLSNIQEQTENSTKSEVNVKASAAGRITALHLPPGSNVMAGQVLGTLVPLDAPGAEVPMQVELYAPGRTTGFVSAGQKVWLRYSAFPYQKFGMGRGLIKGISTTPINPQDLPQGQANALLSAAKSNEPLFRITVELEQPTVRAAAGPLSLKPGMALEADIVQEHRKIWEWVLEPLLSLRQTPNIKFN